MTSFKKVLSKAELALLAELAELEIAQCPRYVWGLAPLTPPAPRLRYFTNFFALAATFSAVNPSSFITTGPGAEAPKRSNPTTSPLVPTYFHQPSVAPASTASLGTPAGSTLALYSAACSSKIFQLGMLTTR